jgi:hypothetical protein
MFLYPSLREHKGSSSVGIMEDHRIIHRTCTSGNHHACAIKSAVFEDIRPLLSFIDIGWFLTREDGG